MRGIEWLHRGTLSAILVSSLVVAVMLGTSMDTYAQGVESPSLDPDGQIVTADNTAFTEKCLSLIDKFSLGKNWRLRQPLLTRSEKWGVVWRVDFTISDADSSHLVNRIVCWEVPDGNISMEIAIGQHLTPLPVAR